MSGRGRPTLTDAQIRAVLDRYTAGEPVADIANDFGVSRPAIHHHVNKAGLPRRKDYGDTPGTPGTNRAGFHKTRPSLVPDRPDWMADALCAQTDPEAFFPEKGQPAEPGRQICARCPVRAECLDYALTNDERYGVWGGLSERQRRPLHDLTSAAKEPA